MGGGKAAMEAKFLFPNSQVENKLQVGASLNNIEMIMQLSQLKGIMRFINDIDAHVKKNPLDKAKMTKKEVDVEDLDLYGTLIMERKRDSPALIKSKSSNTKPKTPPLTQEQKQKKLKSQLKRDKLICKVIQSTQSKEEFKKLKDDLKQSLHQSQSKSEVHLAQSLLLDHSVYQPAVQLSSARKQPLSLNVSFILKKASVTMLMQEQGIQYDRIYDALAQNHTELGPNLINERGGDLARQDQKIGYSHYNMEMRGLSLDVQLSHVQKKRPRNTYEAKHHQDVFLKRLNLSSTLNNLQVHRYDLVNQPLALPKHQQMHQNIHQDTSSMNQYESMSYYSGVFTSAMEFHKLDQTSVLESSKYGLLEKSNISSTSKRGHQTIQQQASSSMSNMQQQQQQMPIANDQQHHCFLHKVFKMNQNGQHYCRETIVECRELAKQHDQVFNMAFKLEEHKKDMEEGQMEINIGSIYVHFGVPELLCLTQAVKDKRFRENPHFSSDDHQEEEQKSDSSIVKQPKKPSKFTLKSLKLALNGLDLELFGPSSANYDYNLCYGHIIENKSIEQLITQQCWCQSEYLNNKTILAIVALNNIIVGYEQEKVMVQAENVEVHSQREEEIKVPLLIIDKVEVVVTQKAQSQEKSENSLMQNNARIVYEGVHNSNYQERAYNTDFNQKLQSDTLQQSNRKRQVISIKLNRVLIEPDTQSMRFYVQTLKNLDQTLKFVLLLQDYHKCFNIEHELNQGKKKPPLNESLMLEVLIDDVQLIVRENNTAIMKFRMHQTKVKVDIRMQAKKERFIIDASVLDVIVLDYLQPQGQFHPMRAKQAAQMFEHSQAQQLLDNNCTFYEELNQSAPLIIMYKQQSKTIKDHPILQLKADVSILIQKKYFDVMSLDTIAVEYAQIYNQASGQQYLITDLYERIVMIKKNPMILSLQACSYGAILRLQIDKNLMGKILKMIADVELAQKEQERPKKQVFESKMHSLDKIKIEVKLQETIIDYWPTLTTLAYDRVFHDNVSSIKFDSEQDSDHYWAPQRAVMHIGEVQMIKLTAESKEKSQIKLQNVSLNVLSQETCDLNMNPILLRDEGSLLYQQGCETYLDYLGFVQIISLNLLEMSLKSKSKVKITFNQVLESQMPDIEESKTQELQSMHQEEEQKEDDHLFYTEVQSQANYQNQLSYAQSVDQSSFKEDALTLDKMKLTLYVKKIMIYVAQDSIKAMNYLARSAIEQIQDLSQALQKGQVKSQKQQEEVKQEEYIDTSNIEDDMIQRILEQFIVMNNDVSQVDTLIKSNFTNTSAGDSSSDSQMSQGPLPKRFEDENQGICYAQFANSIDKEGYFKVNSALIQTDAKKDEGLGINIDLREKVNNEYIKEFKLEDIDDMRHKQFHVLPKACQNFFKKIQVHVEFEGFEVRLYQGSDFDFVMRNNYPKYVQKVIKNPSNRAETLYNSQYPKKVQEHLQGGFLIDDDYLESKPASKLGDKQSLGKSQAQEQFQYLASQKRLRKTNRGFYFSVCLKNAIVRFSELRDITTIQSSKVQQMRLSLSMQSLVIKETISRKGALVRELLQLPYSYKYDNQIELLVSFKVFQNFDEIGFKIKIQPFKLMLNQGSFSFLQKFFEINFQTQNSSQQSAEEILKRSGLDKSMAFRDSNKGQRKPIFVSQLKIHPFQAVFSYTSHKLNIYDLTTGSIVELLNIFNINDLKINIKEYDLLQRIELEKALPHLLEYYRNDLKNNQAFNMVKAVGPLRSMFNIAGAFYGVFKKPYIAYQSERGMLKGFGEGMYDFYYVMTVESVNFTQKLMDGYVKIKKAAEKHL